jgi:hypothetical protein
VDISDVGHPLSRRQLLQDNALTDRVADGLSANRKFREPTPVISVLPVIHVFNRGSRSPVISEECENNCAISAPHSFRRVEKEPLQTA